MLSVFQIVLVLVLIERLSSLNSFEGVPPLKFRFGNKWFNVALVLFTFVVFAYLAFNTLNLFNNWIDVVFAFVMLLELSFVGGLFERPENFVGKLLGYLNNLVIPLVVLLALFATFVA